MPPNHDPAENDTQDGSSSPSQPDHGAGQPPERPEWTSQQQDASWQQPPQDQQWQQPPPGQQWHQPPAGWAGQPPQGQGWQQPPAGWAGQQGWAGYAQQPPYGSSVMVVIGAVVLIIFGALMTLFGAIGVLAGGLIEDALRQIDQMEPTIPLTGLGEVIATIFGVVLVIGILHLISAVGIFLHKQWGRIIGILLAVLGTLFWVLGLVGSLQTTAEADLLLPLVIAVGYGFTLFALIAGGHHFQRRWG